VREKKSRNRHGRKPSGCGRPWYFHGNRDADRPLYRHGR
jgi:hypothetical protein